ncbi:hypothetical protein OD350_11365 [Clostridium beijerinckii]|nr:hypothetical protein OD350_11365 [Clostridium beijerinckii]
MIDAQKNLIYDPTRIMRIEHDDLRVKKKFLKEIAENASKSEFKEAKEKVDDTSKYIVFNLRDHIFKANYILYPTEIETIYVANWFLHSDA